MTVENLISDSRFKEKYILEKFLMHFLSVNREDLWINSDQIISDDVLEKIKSAYGKYVVDKMPLEYILGYVEFFDNKFFVNENTLIPRPETEYMILAVNEYLSVCTNLNSFCLIDVGTGCGVLGLSVLMKNLDVFENIVFSDISEEALEVAKKNYKNFLGNKKLNVNFIKTNLLENTGFDSFLEDKKNVVIVANLPYIPDEMFSQNAPDSVKKYEPRFAFVGGEDGLDLYREMFGQISAVGDDLYSGGVVMFLEMMTWQVDILRKEFNWLDFEEVKTFHFNIRIVKVVLGNNK